MVKHIVCYKLADNSDGERNAAKDMLMSMVGRVGYFTRIEVGIDFLCSSRSYDIVLTVEFPNREALALYQKEEYHVSVVKPYMHSKVKMSVAVDYEI